VEKKTITLWSWLTKREAKNEIACPPDLHVDNEQFAEALAKQVETNRLPAEVVLCEVDWDDTNTKQTRILVRHTGEGASTDIVQFLVGVDQMGNFTYVEEKLYLRPPELPTTPRDQKSGGMDTALAVALGVGGLIGIMIGLAGADDGTGASLACCAFPGAIAIGVALWQGKERSKVNQWNEEARTEKGAWDRVWKSWNSEVLEAAYLASTNDVFGRFALALSSTVKQVIKTLFEDHQAELRSRTEQEKTQKEIEEEMEKRRNEAFK